MSAVKRFYFLTLFPEMIRATTQASMMGRAVQGGLLSVEIINIRDFTTDKHKKVDAPPYGGGAGMVLACQPVVDAYRHIAPQLTPGKTRCLLTSPAGPAFTHRQARHWAEDTRDFVFFCGHYEGFDERIMALIPNLAPVSLGDFVLTGGELPALAMMDALARFVPGVVKEAESVAQDSFENGLLDFPHYTRPAVFEGLPVPEVLLQGNHAEIARWRHAQSLAKTQHYRPDLLE